jgi:hypothetical protein
MGLYTATVETCTYRNPRDYFWSNPKLRHIRVPRKLRCRKMYVVDKSETIEKRDIKCNLFSFQHTDIWVFIFSFFPTVASS